MAKKSTAYKNEYAKEKYDRYSLQLPKGLKTLYKAEADKRGISISALIQTAVKEYLGLSEQ